MFVIGVVATNGLPAISIIRDAAKEAAAIQNAKNIRQMSGALAALGLAHVIHDSMAVSPRRPVSSARG